MRRTALAGFVKALLISALITGGGCAGINPIRTEGLGNTGDLAGLYTLILYRDAEYKGLQTIAFLDLEGDGYTLTPFAPEYNYSAIRNLSGQEALRRAEAFIRQTSGYMSSQASRITDSAGKTIGYEVRPLYNPTDHGLSDVLDVSYSLRENGIIEVRVKLLKSVENEFTDL